MNINRALVALVVPLALTGCSLSVESSDGSSSKESSTTANVDSDTVEQVYLTMLRSEYPADFVGPSDEMLVENAHRMCDAFDDGATFATMAMATLQSGYSPDVGGFLIGATIAAYCPEHQDLVQ